MYNSRCGTTHGTLHPPSCKVRNEAATGRSVRYTHRMNRDGSTPPLCCTCTRSISARAGRNRTCRLFVHLRQLRPPSRTAGGSTLQLKRRNAADLAGTVLTARIRGVSTRVHRLAAMLLFAVGSSCCHTNVDMCAAFAHLNTKHRIILVTM
jgi:hypothetical protein